MDEMTLKQLVLGGMENTKRYVFHLAESRYKESDPVENKDEA